MSDVNDLLIQLKGFPQFLSRTSDEFVNVNSVKIVQANRDQIQKDGEDIFGNKLGRYKPSSARARRARGLQTNFIDLKFTGEFSESINEKKVKPFTHQIRSDNAVFKEFLLPRFGQVIGLNKKNESEFDSDFKSTITKEMGNYFR